MTALGECNAITCHQGVAVRGKARVLRCEGVSVVAFVRICTPRKEASQSHGDDGEGTGTRVQHCCHERGMLQGRAVLQPRAPIGVRPCSEEHLQTCCAPVVNGGLHGGTAIC